ncbi:unnamed protein product [Lactuca virosa]|uniref:Uncharacterized protein n=1 Tax=Lactuca virosa TaxID=75947 RepID=A0AAU9NU32_9ASTR|nr:unnamed protein product [Lactuca virosa]
MDKSGVESKLMENGNQERDVMNGEKVEEDEEDESKKLLLPKKGGLSKKSGKKHRKVQWNDRNGHDLTEVLEYQPSEVSDSEDDESDSCICNIM